MPKKLLLLLCLTATPILAQTADVRISSLTQSHEASMTGQRIAFTVRWRNEGPSPAPFINVRVTGAPTPFFIVSTATSGYPCYPSVDGSFYLCQNPELAAGAEAEMVLQVLAPTIPGPFTMRFEVSSAAPDPLQSNNVVERTWQLAPSPEADLSMSPIRQTHPAESGDTVSIPLTIRNEGPEDAQNLIAYFSVPVTENIPPFSVNAAGWSCGGLPFGPQAVICTRNDLDAGESSAFQIETTVPANAETYSIHGRIGATLRSDANLSDDFMSATIQIGDVVIPPEEPEWARILVPLTADDIPGNNNSLWRTETTALIASHQMIDIHPRPCKQPRIVLAPCLTVPLGRQFNAREPEVIWPGWPNGQFLYVRVEDRSKLRLNSRVFDVSRQEETAGSEIPIARDEDFTSAAQSLLGIPVASHYRHTLRVYDLDAHAGAEVRISVYADAETTPRVTVTRALSVSPDLVTTEIGLPSHPGYLQLDPAALASLAGIEKMRIDVEPAASGMRIWSFVSVTNNDTHHVTTFSAQ